jgi:hypothetical protein
MDDDDTVYCNVQMPVAQGKELLPLVTVLRKSRAHPNLDLVFDHKKIEVRLAQILQMSFPYYLITSTERGECAQAQKGKGIIRYFQQMNQPREAVWNRI